MIFKTTMIQTENIFTTQNINEKQGGYYVYQVLMILNWKTKHRKK